MLVSLDTGQAEEDFRVAADVESDVGGYVRSVVNELGPQAEASGVDLSVETDGDLPDVLISPRHLQAVLRHLVENGIKFARPGIDSFVRVRVQASEADGGGVEIAIEDNGIGIREEELNRIFEPLTQIDRLRQEQQGVGLGLTIARGLIELHGGEMWADSTVGSGTSVHFRLPEANGEIGLSGSGRTMINRAFGNGAQS